MATTLLTRSAETQACAHRRALLEAVDHARRLDGRRREPRERRADRVAEDALRRVDQPQQLLDRRRLLAHAVGVVGRVAEQRVRQLGLAAQHGLRPGRLRYGGHAGERERADLRARVEARAVHMAVYAAVASGRAGLDARLEQ